MVRTMMNRVCGNIPRPLVWVALLWLLPLALSGQQTASSSSFSSAELELPDAPGRQSASSSPELQQGTGSISGVVLDINDGMVPNATVTLVEENHADRIVISDSEGRFSFTSLPPGKFKITISATGLSSFVSNQIVLHPGERHELAQIGLPPTTNLDVQVTVTQVEIAQEQVELQEKQRAFGVFPNFYSSYVWDAAPLSTKQKFGLATKSITDPVIFVVTGIAAGVEQALNTFPVYGQGTKGYAQRYLADYGDELANRMFSSAIYPTIFHQDPRYFYKGSGSKASRAWYAITRAVVTRGDNGKSQPNYSRLLAGVTVGALSETYHLGSDRNVNIFLRNGIIAIGGHAADNLLREFLFKAVTTNVPDYANGEAATQPSRK